MNDNAALIALGANLPFDGLMGAALLSRALSALQAEGLAVRAVSGVWRTAAWPPGTEQPDYFNAAAELDSAGRAPRLLYDALRAIEARFGRERRERWAARTMDLDIIAMDGFVGTFGGVTLPHPRMQERAFVLAPLAEIAPGWRHPVSGATPGDMLAALGRVEGCSREGDLAVGTG